MRSIPKYFYLLFIICILLNINLIISEDLGGGSSAERHTLTATAGQLVTISERHLPTPTELGRDVDPSQIEYHVTRPLVPEDGHLLLMYAPGLEVVQFTQADVRRMDLVFVPPPHHLVPQERAVHFKFTVMAPRHLNHVTRDLEETFSVLLLPQGHREPRFRVPDPVIKLGKSLIFNISRKYFEVEGFGEDTSNVQYMLTEGPSHGALAILFYDGNVRILQPEEEFSGADISRAAAVQYQREDQDDSDHDLVEVLATDTQAEAVSQLKLNFMENVEQQQPASREEIVALQVNEGERVILTSDYFSYALSGGGGRSQVSYALLDSPHYGALTLSSGNMERALGHSDTFTQDDANKGRLAYRALSEIGRHQVTERIPLRIADSSGSRYRPQLLAITVSPTDNQAPLLLVNGEVVVREGGEETLSSQLITVLDVDSADDQLILELDVPPTFGHIDINGDRGAAQFSVAALRNGAVRYLQSIHRGAEPTRDVLLFHASDGINRSPSMRLNISIELINDEPPALITDTLEVEAAEGAVITNSSLYVGDFDTPASVLVITLLQEPAHGVLRLRESRHRPLGTGTELSVGAMFTYMDVLEDLITFIPFEGNQETSDSFVLSVSDGDFTDQAALDVHLALKSGTAIATQTLAINMPSGGMQILGSSELAGRRLILLQAPASGMQVQIRKRGVWMLLQVGNEITKQDVESGATRIVHTSGGSVFPLRFRVEDVNGQHSRNLVLIASVRQDIAPPSVDVNRELHVRLGSSTVLSSTHLAASDLDTAPSDLIFTVIRGPQFGKLKFKNEGETTTWSQADLNAGRINLDYQALNGKHRDTFLFSLTDKTSTVSGEFVIHIQDEIKKDVNVEVHPVNVRWGERIAISQFEIHVTDITRPEYAVFNVIVAPKYGSFQIQQGDEFTNKKSFSLLDLAEGRVFYLHEAVEADETKDEAQLSMTCNGGKKCQHTTKDTEIEDLMITLPVLIHHVKSGAPKVVTNIGLPNLQYVNSKGVGFLSRSVLLTVSGDTPSHRMVYSVTRPPDYGLLYTTEAVDTPVSVFTQEDLDQGKIFYQLDDENDFKISKDDFEFQVTDSKSNVLKENNFHIQWSWVYFESTTYNATETDGILRLTIRRDGGVSRQSSTVRCHLISNSGRGAATWGSNVSRHNDVELQHELIQFDGFETEKFCTIKIQNDNKYEGDEYFSVELSAASRTLLGAVRRSRVILRDPEDQPTFTFKSKIMHVNETDGPMSIHIYRNGDASSVASVRCSTQAGSAKGSDQVTNHNSDFISRPDTDASLIIFQPGEHVKLCQLQIIDDALYEDTEDFWVILTNPSANSVLGTITKLKVQIVGTNDVSQIHFSQIEHYFLENAGGVDIAVSRSGPDLSQNASVWCTTLALDAQPKMDYVPMSQQVSFGRGDVEAWCRLTLLDDAGDPMLEGRERLRLVLSHADGATLVEPTSATIVIDDSATDTPTLQFAESQMTVLEDSGTIRVMVQRSGDIRQNASVKCYTSARSAREGDDFKERPKTERSRVMFAAGQSTSFCDVEIMNDAAFEGEKDFVLRLAEPLFEDLDTGQQKLALIGDRAVMRVRINDQEDMPRIYFQQQDLSLNKPADELQLLKIKILRSGDTSGTATVHVSSRDGSAISGSDYLAVSNQVTFYPDMKSIDIEITILPADDDGERREAKFSLLLDENNESAAIVSIRSQSAGALVLPAQPLVVSLLYYDNATSPDVTPDPGYPLVCISPCEERHPHYSRSRHLCAAIKFRSIEYFWEVAVPSGLQVVSHSGFKKLTKSTIFAKVDSKILDPMYFTSHFQIRCGVQPVKLNGRLGIPTKSLAVTIGMSKLFCKNIESDHEYFNRNQAFNANLKYINSTSHSHPNTVHINIEIPHTDGRVPLISTQPLHNVQALLTESLYSLPHTCSNMLVNRGFLIADALRTAEHKVQYFNLYEQDIKLRGSETVQLYRHLNLRTCLWSFDAWFHMTELIDNCHGKVVSESKIAEKGQSELRVEVPLHVAYVHASGAQQWSAVEHRTTLQVTLRYSALLWHQGLTTEPKLAATLHVSRVSANDDGQMMIEFWTQALFRGLFVMAHHTLPRQTSALLAPRRLSGLGFVLELLRGESTWEGPRQHWRATSNASLADFSGEYVAMLVPCAVSAGTSYSDVNPSPCQAHLPTKLSLQITFQAPARPLPAQFKLQTQFEVTKNPRHFLADPADPQFYHDGDAAWRFSEGETVLGRVSWHAAQDLREAYRLNIERVLVCAPRQGEQLDSKGESLGCLLPSQALAQRFILLDREHPDTADQSVNGVDFEARFVRDVEAYRQLEDRPGVDGFIWKVDPLYQIGSEQQWYMQVLYKIHASDSNKRKKRNIDLWHEGSAMKPLFLIESSSAWHERTSLPVIALLSLPIIAAVSIVALRVYERFSRASYSIATLQPSTAS